MRVRTHPNKLLIIPPAQGPFVTGPIRCDNVFGGVSTPRPGKIRTGGCSVMEIRGGSKPKHSLEHLGTVQCANGGTGYGI